MDTEVTCIVNDKHEEHRLLLRKLLWQTVGGNKEDVDTRHNNWSDLVIRNVEQ